MIYHHVQNTVQAKVMETFTCVVIDTPIVITKTNAILFIWLPYLVVCLLLISVGDFKMLEKLPTCFPFT